MKSNTILKTAISGVFALTTFNTLADEGQWQPHQIADLQHEFSRIGIELPAKQVADLTQYPMNAMVGLGYCSASFVSPKGLVVTNHHCAYGAIQNNTTVDNNVAKNGFLARNISEEPSAGPQERLYITEKVTDVTEQVIGNIEHTASGKKYYDAIQSAKKKLIKQCEQDANYRCSVRAFHHGMQYFLLKSLMIKDVRLVYAPPEAVGNYGADIDNFEYPRHTGDFAFFRAYVDKNGNPAPYSKDNVPYEPKSYLKLNAKGVKAGDPIILAGTPGRTSRYKLAEEIAFAADWDYPSQVDMYYKTLAVIEKATKNDEKAKVAYSSRVKSINNRLKKREGLLAGFKVTDIHGIKQQKEQKLLDWIAKDSSRKQYADAHKRLSELLEHKHNMLKRDFLYDYAQDSALLRTAMRLYRLAKESEKPDSERKQGYQERDLPMIKARLKRMGKTFAKPVDMALWKYYLEQYVKQDEQYRVKVFDRVLQIGGDHPTEEVVASYYRQTKLDDEIARLAWIGQPVKNFKSSDDPFIQLAVKIYDTNMEFETKSDELMGQLARSRPNYMRAIIAYNESLGKPVYPDANGTMRVTYGTVDGYPARDGVYKTPFTSVNGMMVKNTDKYPFNVPGKVKRAYQNGLVGDYKMTDLSRENTKGCGVELWCDPSLRKFNDVPVNFLTSADTTGGNSGSPVMNGRGELIGLNFDSTYESITKDWYFNAEITRAIHVDIRYVLWILQYVEKAQHLVDEMTIIKE